MDSAFLERHGRNPILATKTIAKNTNVLFPVGLKNADTFKREMRLLNTIIEPIAKRSSVLQFFETFVKKSKKQKGVNMYMLEKVANVHSRFPVVRHISSLLDVMFYKLMEKHREDRYDEYYDDYTCFEDDCDDDCDDDYDDYYGSKRRQKKHVSLHELCEKEIEQEKNLIEKNKQKFNYEMAVVRRKDGDMYVICEFLNMKTSQDWGIFSLIVSYL